MAERRLRLLDEPGEPMGAYLRAVLERDGALGESGNVVLPRLTGELICRVYAGVCDEPRSHLVLETLLAGGTVWSPWEGLCLTGRGSMARLVRQRLEVLRRSGLVLCPLGALARMARQGRRRGYGAWPGERLGVVHPQGGGAGGV